MLEFSNTNNYLITATVAKIYGSTPFDDSQLYAVSCSYTVLQSSLVIRTVFKFWVIRIQSLGM